MSNSNIDDLFPCISCGVNADPADGFGKCTCGNEAKREAIQQELLKARIDELKLNAYYSQGKKTDPLKLCGISKNAEEVNDRITNLQAKLKGDDK